MSFHRRSSEDLSRLSIAIRPTSPAFESISPTSSTSSRKSKLSSTRKSATTTLSAQSPVKKPISEDEYFRLLKKTDVLGYLVRVHSDLEHTNAQLKTAQSENTKLDVIQQHVFGELEVFVFYSSNV